MLSLSSLWNHITWILVFLMLSHKALKLFAVLKNSFFLFVPHIGWIPLSCFLLNFALTIGHCYCWLIFVVFLLYWISWERRSLLVCFWKLRKVSSMICMIDKCCISKSESSQQIITMVFINDSMTRHVTWVFLLIQGPLKFIYKANV